ncbi:MAG: hypothetical protein K5696_00930 [Lachnospiraceae bacterium]|nr:hypothetical protein [Lachnospiraceae bacterium]
MRSDGEDASDDGLSSEIGDASKADAEDDGSTDKPAVSGETDAASGNDPAESPADELIENSGTEGDGSITEGDQTPAGQAEEPASAEEAEDDEDLPDFIIWYEDPELVEEDETGSETGWMEPGREAGEDGDESISVTAGKKGSEYKVYRFLTDKLHLNTAAACGVLANIYCESGFRLNALGDHGTSYGLCQWHNGRKSRLLKFLVAHDYEYDDLDGQLLYLKEELSGSYRNVYDYLSQVDNSADGANQAARYFCIYFEAPAKVMRAAKTRGELAKNSYWPAYSENREEIVTITAETESTVKKGTVRQASLSERKSFRRQWNALRAGAHAEMLIDAGKEDSRDDKTTAADSQTDSLTDSQTDSRETAATDAVKGVIPGGFMRMLPHLLLNRLDEFSRTD